MKTLKPFANDTESQNIGGLTVENGASQLNIYGTLELTRDKNGLKRAQELRGLFEKVVQALEADQDLPTKVVETTTPPQKVKNPFG